MPVGFMVAAGAESFLKILNHCGLLVTVCLHTLEFYVVYLQNFVHFSG